MQLPPIYLATLRDKMLDLALAMADGAIWANASRRYMPTQVARVEGRRPRRRSSWPTWCPTVIDADLDAARAIHRRTLAGYVTLPNYRNYWKQAGYEEEMDAIEDALAAGDRDGSPTLMTDAWIDDCTISGSARCRARATRRVDVARRAADRGDVVDHRWPGRGDR